MFKYSNYLREIGDIDRVFSVFIQGTAIIPIATSKLTLDDSEIIANQTQAFNEQMYYKFNYDKINETLFIPVKNSTLNQTSLISANLSSRIGTAKPKTTTVFRAYDSEQSTIVPNLQKTVSDYTRPINLNFNENMNTSMAVGSPIGEGMRTKSFVDERADFMRKKKRVMSAKYESHCYLKIKDKSSFEERPSALGLFANTYKPKQLTTDKCKFI